MKSRLSISDLDQHLEDLPLDHSLVLTTKMTNSNRVSLARVFFARRARYNLARKMRGAATIIRGLLASTSFVFVISQYAAYGLASSTLDTRAQRTLTHNGIVVVDNGGDEGVLEGGRSGGEEDELPMPDESSDEQAQQDSYFEARRRSNEPSSRASTVLLQREGRSRGEEDNNQEEADDPSSNGSPPPPPPSSSSSSSSSALQKTTSLQEQGQDQGSETSALQTTSLQEQGQGQGSETKKFVDWVTMATTANNRAVPDTFDYNYNPLLSSSGESGSSNYAAQNNVYYESPFSASGGASETPMERAGGGFSSAPQSGGVYDSRASPYDYYAGDGPFTLFIYQIIRLAYSYWDSYMSVVLGLRPPPFSSAEWRRYVGPNQPPPPRGPCFSPIGESTTCPVASVDLGVTQTVEECARKGQHCQETACASSSSADVVGRPVYDTFVFGRPLIPVSAPAAASSLHQTGKQSTSAFQQQSEQRLPVPLAAPALLHMHEGTRFLTRTSGGGGGAGNAELHHDVPRSRGALSFLEQESVLNRRWSNPLTPSAFVQNTLSGRGAWVPPMPGPAPMIMPQMPPPGGSPGGPYPYYNPNIMPPPQRFPNPPSPAAPPRYFPPSSGGSGYGGGGGYNSYGGYNPVPVAMVPPSSYGLYPSSNPGNPSSSPRSILPQQRNREIPRQPSPAAFRCFLKKSGNGCYGKLVPDPYFDAFMLTQCQRTIERKDKVCLTRVEKGSYCQANMKYLGKSHNPSHCALAIRKEGALFTFGDLGPDSGGCYEVLTSDPHCPGGFNVDVRYDTYRISDCDMEGNLITFVWNLLCWAVFVVIGGTPLWLLLLCCYFTCCDSTTSLWGCCYEPPPGYFYNVPPAPQLAGGRPNAVPFVIRPDEVGLPIVPGAAAGQHPNADYHDHHAGPGVDKTSSMNNFNNGAGKDPSSASAVGERGHAIGATGERIVEVPRQGNMAPGGQLHPYSMSINMPSTMHDEDYHEHVWSHQVHSVNQHMLAEVEQHGMTPAHSGRPQLQAVPFGGTRNNRNSATPSGAASILDGIQEVDESEFLREQQGMLEQLTGQGAASISGGHADQDRTRASIEDDDDDMAVEDELSSHAAQSPASQMQRKKRLNPNRGGSAEGEAVAPEGESGMDPAIVNAPVEAGSDIFASAEGGARTTAEELPVSSAVEVKNVGEQVENAGGPARDPALPSVASISSENPPPSSSQIVPTTGSPASPRLGSAREEGGGFAVED
ncbi:unnamed protein product [Amoebophrya sp. A25]|nr:unnamed protein product [Amoebophrya sp. A25]|eukprot:GSA25T00025650001.1